MNDALQARMAEATRLTRQGRVAEATALIQRTLGSAGAPAERSRDSGDAKEPIEGSVVAVDDVTVGGTAARDTTRRPGAATDVTPPEWWTGVGAGLPGLPDVSALVGGSTGTLRPSRPAPGTGRDAGRFLRASHSGPAGTMGYHLYIPSGYAGQAVPLLVMLHGCGQSPADFAAGTRMNDLAEAHTFLVAYPAQSQAANASRCWNWFERAHQSRARGEPSLIAGLTQEVMAAYAVDAERVYVAGLSAGGAMAAVMAAAYPDLFAAAGVHSGLAYGAAGDLMSALAAQQRGGTWSALPDTPGVPPRVVPLIVFHGERDTTVSPRNADQVVAQWTSAHGLDGVAPETTARMVGGQETTRAIYRDAGGRSLVEMWRVQGLGHAWFGGNPSGPYATAQGPDASAEMVRFFSEHADD